MKITQVFKVAGPSPEKDAFFTNEKAANTYSGNSSKVQTIYVFESEQDKKKFDAISKLSGEEIDLLGLDQIIPFKSAQLQKMRRILCESSIHNFKLSDRLVSALDTKNINTLKGVIVKHQSNKDHSVKNGISGLLDIRNFGKKSFEEIEKKLKELDCSLDMDITPYL